MVSENELKAMMILLQDSDPFIATEIEHRLTTLGAEVIPFLEEIWEESFDLDLQDKLEKIIHNIQFETIQNELQIWKMSNSFNLLDGLLIINNYQYPSSDNEKIILFLEEMKREIWLQMNYDMSPMEVVKLLNHVMYVKYNFSGNTSDYHNPANSYLYSVLETRKGNPISLACIYAILAQKLDIPIFGVNLPRHFILAYRDIEETDKQEDILFYINAFNRGQIMQKSDIVSFLRQLNLPLTREYAMPCDNITIVTRVLRNLKSAYQQLDNPAKVAEIDVLLQIILD